MTLPDVRIGMNPRLGMVGVPTWFWVEGYDGGARVLNSSISATRQECHPTVERDARGDAVLGEDGAPATHETCHTFTDTLSVEVRAWPKQYAWDFGDAHAISVPCSDGSACPRGLGQAFSAVSGAGPGPRIEHAYTWSSLARSGSLDAYSVGLGITFGAQFRFGLNSTPNSTWQTLNDRTLTWADLHQVREAQAILVRP
jgi:hypothetical protein